MNSRSEKRRLYWIGKKPSVKKAVKEYMEKTPNITQREIANQYNVSEQTIGEHLKNLENKGLFENPKKINECLNCGINLYGKYPKYKIVEDRKGSNQYEIIGYICRNCYKKITKTEVSE